MLSRSLCLKRNSIFLTKVYVILESIILQPYLLPALCQLHHFFIVSLRNLLAETNAVTATAFGCLTQNICFHLAVYHGGTSSIFHTRPSFLILGGQGFVQLVLSHPKSGATWVCGPGSKTDTFTSRNMLHVF